MKSTNLIIKYFDMLHEKNFLTLKTVSTKNKIVDILTLYYYKKSNKSNVIYTMALDLIDLGIGPKDFKNLMSCISNANIFSQINLGGPTFIHQQLRRADKISYDEIKKHYIVREII